MGLFGKKKSGNIVNNNNKAPRTTRGFEGKNFWQEEITNNDYLKLFSRGGVGNRVLTKEGYLMFKNNYVLNNDKAFQIVNDFRINEVAAFSRINAQISGWCLIYIDWADGQELSEAADTSNDPLSFYVVPVAWVAQDMVDKRTGKTYDYYKIYKTNGAEFEVHKSRFIRVALNPFEMSRFMPAFNALQVLDNVSWGVGQTMFRSGAGFPVLKVDEKAVVETSDGKLVPKGQFYRDIGIMKDMNTEVGMILSKDDELDFLGAQGKAIEPSAYWEAALQKVAIDLDVPVDILKGVSAGAVTGSETNIREYYADIKGKQKSQAEPIINDMLSCFGIDTSELEYSWNPIWEMTQMELTERFQKDSQSMHLARLRGQISYEQELSYLEDQYKMLNYNEFDSSKLEPVAEVIVFNQNVLPVPDPNAPQPNGLFNKNLDITHVKKQYDISDKEINDSFDASEGETSVYSSKIQATEKKYQKDLNKQYKNSQKLVTDLLIGYNTDT